VQLRGSPPSRWITPIRLSALDAELSPAGLDQPTPAARSPEAEAAHVHESGREDSGGRRG
jgi:hypothetical protein